MTSPVCNELQELVPAWCPVTRSGGGQPEHRAGPDTGLLRPQDPHCWQQGGRGRGGETACHHPQYGLECLANLEQLPARGFTLTTLPLNIGD